MSGYEHIFDPTTRVKSAVAAFLSVSESISYKGFLGPSLRENDSFPSVGVSSARRSGVIVDDNGKMRCPPGTPNANQFTDINMSNCMVPSTETLAQQAADVAANAAKKSIDGFKRGSHDKKQKDRDLIPNAGVGFANPDGFLEQRRIQKGVSVVSPVDGSQTELTELNDSIKHLSDGGQLSDIPDEHLVRAIEGNPERFSIVGTGGGVNGMTRMRDNKTGALLGIKYAEDKYRDSSDEAIREVASELILEHMGYDPMPMRLVPNIHKSDSMGEEWKGVALVTELAHNRNNGTIESARISDRDGEYKYNVDPVELIRMAMLDAILQNGDRHEGNFMIARDESGSSSIVPIDHSSGLAYTDDRPVELLVSAPWGVGVDAEMVPYYEAENTSKLMDDISSVQEQIRNIDVTQLEQQMQQLYSYLGGMGSAPSTYQKESIQAAIDRISRIADAENQRIFADSLVPEYKRPRSARTLVDFVDPFADPPSDSFEDVA